MDKFQYKCRLHHKDSKNGYELCMSYTKKPDHTNHTISKHLWAEENHEGSQNSASR
jgi:hypothetical protein